MSAEKLPWQVEGPMLICEVCHCGQPPGVRREGEGAECIHCNGNVVRVVPLSEVKEALLGEEAIQALADAVYEGPLPETWRPHVSRALQAIADAAFPSTDSEGQG